MRATRIKMRYGCGRSYNLEEIDEIYIEGIDRPQYFPKEFLHDYLEMYPKSIYVGIPPYPYLIPEESKYREKYVKSSPNMWGHDNLLELPRD